MFFSSPVEAAAVGFGPGAESRRPMAVATAAGMVSSTVLTLLVVPVFYVLIDDGAEWVKARVRRLLGRPPAGEAPVEARASAR